MRDYFELYTWFWLYHWSWNWNLVTLRPVASDGIMFFSWMSHWYILAWHIYMTKQNCKELRPRTGFLILCDSYVVWIVFLLSNAVLGAFVHAGRVAVGCCAWAKIGSWNTRFQSCLKSIYRLVICQTQECVCCWWVCERMHKHMEDSTTVMMGVFFFATQLIKTRKN